MTLSPGNRIELIRMEHDPDPVPMGTQGTVTLVCDHGDWTQVWVDWDNGRRLALVLPEDQCRIIGPKTSSQTLALPL